MQNLEQELKNSKDDIKNNIDLKKEPEKNSKTVTISVDELLKWDKKARDLTS